MNREEILTKYNEEEKIFVAKILDKIKLAKTKNKIVNTDFLDMYKQKIAINILNIQKEKDYKLFKPCEEADKAILIVYPEKYEDLFTSQKFDFGSIVSVIRVTLPNMLKGEYSHKDYLSGIMKLGIVREKIGDIFVFEDGADIIVLNEIKKYILDNLGSLTRFSKSNIEEISLTELRKPNIKREEIRITVSALRLDCIVSEMANMSRTSASDIISQQRVFVNYEMEVRNSKEIKEQDVIVIRGKGKFRIKEILGETKKGKTVVIIEHYR